MDMESEFKELVQSLKRKIDTDDCEGCIRGYQNSANFVRDHWLDEGGKMVYKEIEADEAAFLDLEKRRQALIMQTQELMQRLQAIADDAQETGRRSSSARNSRGKGGSSTDDEYTDGDGYSRRRYK